MAKKTKRGDDKKLFAFLATFFTIVGFIIALVAKREDKYVMFYAKHGLVLFIGSIAIGIVAWIPIVGWITGPILWIFLVVLWVIAWINALSGKQKRTFIISDLADKIDL